MLQVNPAWNDRKKHILGRTSSNLSIFELERTESGKDAKTCFGSDKIKKRKGPSASIKDILPLVRNLPY